MLRIENSVMWKREEQCNVEKCRIT